MTSLPSDPPTAKSTEFDDSPPDTSNNPPSKSDKPRPHVCGTCARSFARLEHLKRHERSHTKEKPFECPECTRCFARRDLLLRHQQKLHMTTTPASKPRQNRRESNASLAPNPTKVRKNSVANATPTGRPRANTISHIDGTLLGKLVDGSVSNDGASTPGADGMYGLSRVHTADEHYLAQHSRNQAHPNLFPLNKFSTHGLGGLLGGGMRTAPIESSLVAGFDFDQLFGPGSTINPAQLQVGDAVSPNPQFNGHYPGQVHGNTVAEEDENLDWMRGFNQQMSFNNTNPHNIQTHDHALAESSPSGISNGSAEHLPSIDLHSNHVQPNIWHANMAPQQMSAPAHYYHENTNSFFPEFGMPPEQNNKTFGSHLHHVDSNFMNNPAILGIGSSGGLNGLTGRPIRGMAFSSDGNSISSSSVNGSARNSNATTIATDSITEITRQTLLVSLSQPSVFGLGHRKYSTPAIRSPLSPRDAAKPNLSGGSLPSTSDFQRYVSAYIHYFHPHFPFLHIPTLSFDSPAYTTTLRQATPNSTAGVGGIMGGGGCLILATAAIGALYEFDRSASKDLFEASKRLIQLYLEERRKIDVSAAKSTVDTPAQSTPLWLVQAMLLNVIYGHNCGDKTSGDIASTHCAALISLARSAELVRPLGASDEKDSSKIKDEDTHMENGLEFSDDWNTNPRQQDINSQWQLWAAGEERKRTLYAIYHMSSLLVSAYNHAPALMNSEIQLDLPCDEELWCAESASVWLSKGGRRLAEQKALPFGTALSILLGASQTQREQGLLQNEPFGSGVPRADVPQSDLQPSTFGCLILIDALHNYIWETRQRHTGRQWTTQETESMHAHIEPALRAWQAAWAANPMHSLERPNPFGLGPLSADSVPLLDLAYVRLFVNLGSSKETFWQRDFDAMAEELARGAEIIQHAEHSEFPTDTTNTANASRIGSPGLPSRQNGHEELDTSSQGFFAADSQRQSSKRERHLRKAAFYAADSLSMSDKLNVTFADFTSRELPVQSALCAFDCAQVLAEWLATVQERVGRYLGILGKADIDYQQVPAIMLLEDEDCKLLEKVADILNKAEAKMTYEISGMGTSAAMAALNTLPSMSGAGYGSKILMITAYLLERAAVWPGELFFLVYFPSMHVTNSLSPVTGIMAQALQVQAMHMNKRAETSLALH